jgi:hypothetical protein
VVEFFWLKMDSGVVGILRPSGAQDEVHPAIHLEPFFFVVQRLIGGWHAHVFVGMFLRAKDL